MFRIIAAAVCSLFLAGTSSAAAAEDSTASFDPSSLPDKMKLAAVNLTTGGPYTYSQSGHHFYGVAYDGSYIDTKSACAGANDSCRNNPSCQCTKNEGPLPQGTYTLGDMFTYKGYPYSYGKIYKLLIYSLLMQLCYSSLPQLVQ